MPMLDCPIPKKDWLDEAGARNGSSAPLAGKTSTKRIADAGPWEPSIQKILGFEHLTDDWDGLGAKAPSRELLESAVGLGYLFFERGVPPPSRVVPGLDGAVILEWQDPDGTYADVEIVEPFFAEVMFIEPGKPPKHWILPTP